MSSMILKLHMGLVIFFDIICSHELVRGYPFFYFYCAGAGIARRGFDPPLGKFSGRGDFSLGVNTGSNSIPQKTLSDESINRGLVCAHMHFIARTQKILTFMS